MNMKDIKHAENNDIPQGKEDVKNMIESLEDNHQELSENACIEHFLKFENSKIVLNEEDLKTSIEEIEKMDAVLKIKVTEEKKAKLSRIQAEEESRNILARLPCSEMSSGIKVNLQEFIRLLNEVEKPRNVPDSSDGPGQKELEESGKKAGRKEKTPNFKFVERNIQRAKCGRGTLSLTDEEKLRIEKLLMDIENFTAKNVEESKGSENPETKMISENEKEFFAIDEETKSILNDIDQQLEMLAKEKKSSKENQSEISLLKKTESTEKLFDEDEKENPNNGRSQDRQSNRLKEINKLLNSMNSVSNEEISPLTVEEIKSLVERFQRSEQSIIQRRPAAIEESHQADEKEGLGSKPPYAVIAELVSSAKFLMPKFQYRFDEPRCIAVLEGEPKK